MALETVFSLLNVRWSLSGEDTGNVDSVSGRGANTIEVGSESSANRGIHEVALHHTKLGLGIVFSLVKLNALVLYCLELTLMRSIPINISDNTGVFKINDGVVDKKSGSGGRMEDVEVVIFDPRSVEVWRGVCTCVKRNGVFRIALLVNSYKVSINPNLSEGDVLCYFVLPILIEEDQRVLSRITAIVLAPSETWVIWVV